MIVYVLYLECNCVSVPVFFFYKWKMIVIITRNRRESAFLYRAMKKKGYDNR